MHLRDKLARGEFVVLAELTPPKGVDTAAMLQAAAQLAPRADALVVSEMTGAVMRMSALGAAVLLEQRGFSSVLEIHGRDRNRLALQADLLAAAALGVRNVIVTCPEDPPAGDHPQAKAVHDLQTVELLQTLQQLQQGRDLGGNELQGSPSFLVGAAARTPLRGEAIEKQLPDLRALADKGAAYFLCPPLFDLETIGHCHDVARNAGLKLVPTILLLKSVGMARYIDAHIEHIRVPPGLIDRLQKAEDSHHEAIRIAVEALCGLRSAGFAGVCLAAMGWEPRMAEILEAAGLPGPAAADGIRQLPGGSQGAYGH